MRCCLTALHLQFKSYIRNHLNCTNELKHTTLECVIICGLNHQGGRLIYSLPGFVSYHITVSTYYMALCLFHGVWGLCDRDYKVNLLERGEGRSCRLKIK
jgi:hypothetical protein